MKNCLLICSVALVFVAAGIFTVAHSRPVSSNSQEHTVTTTEGKTITVKVKRREFTANAPDGTYKLTNGGAIRVRGGKVVWDAFGAVRRHKTGQWKGVADPLG